MNENVNGAIQCACIVIFGASGDLSFRKLLPSFYDLYSLKQLPKDFVIPACLVHELTSYEHKGVEGQTS